MLHVAPIGPRRSKPAKCQRQRWGMLHHAPTSYDMIEPSQGHQPPAFADAHCAALGPQRHWLRKCCGLACFRRRGAPSEHIHIHIGRMSWDVSPFSMLKFQFSSAWLMILMLRPYQTLNLALDFAFIATKEEVTTRPSLKAWLRRI